MNDVPNGGTTINIDNCTDREWRRFLRAVVKTFRQGYASPGGEILNLRKTSVLRPNPGTILPEDN